MEIQRKKILLEDSVDRTINSPTWGIIPLGTCFYINILLTQSMDNMGIFTDIEYFPKTGDTNSVIYTVLTDKLKANNIVFPFMTGATESILESNLSSTEQKEDRLPKKVESDFYNYLKTRISGYTDSKLEDVRSYKATDPYRIGFDVETSSYYNYEDVSVSGHSRILSMQEPRKYVFDAITGSTMGTPNQEYGIQYLDYTGQTRIVNVNDLNSSIPVTEFSYKSEGWNKRNISLSALTKEEYLFGIISPPEVKSDVFIDRGITSVMDKHLRLSEIKDLGQLARYGNGFYKLNKQ